jgi:hypothetical protein
MHFVTQLCPKSLRVCPFPVEAKETHVSGNILQRQRLYRLITFAGNYIRFARCMVSKNRILYGVPTKPTGSRSPREPIITHTGTLLQIGRSRNSQASRPVLFYVSKLSLGLCRRVMV